MRVIREDCFVLRTTPFSESSLIVDVLSRNFGRLNLLAKGAKQTKSQYRGVLMPFQLLSINWSGKGSVPTMTTAYLQNDIVEIRGEFLYSAYHLNELLVKLFHTHDPHPDLFESYLLAVNELANCGKIPQTLRIFEKLLLKELGYALILETEFDGKAPVLANKTYSYEFDKGPVPVLIEGSMSISGQTLLALASGNISSRQEEKESRMLLEQAIARYLEGKELHCRNVYRQTLRKREMPKSISSAA